MTQEQVNGGSTTADHLRGELAEVLDAINLIFRQYDPRGYATRVNHIEFDGKEYVAKVSRGNSCD